MVKGTMMICETHLAPPNSLIVIMDRTVGRLPDSMNRSLVSATESCIAVGTLGAADGETTISLSDETPPWLPKQSPQFDGIVRTPSKNLSVCTVFDDILMTVDVPGPSTRVRIWTNDSSEPSEVWIVAGTSPR